MVSAAFRHRASQRLILLLVVWAIYLSTGATVPTYYDTGELTTAATLLGSGHPPGQPLFSQLGALSTLVPLGSALTRLAWLSGLLMLAVLWFSVQCGRLLLLGSAPMTAGQAPAPMGEGFEGRVLEAFWVLSLGLSLPLWLQAHRPEVYALHLLLVMLGLWQALLLSQAEKRELRWYFGLALVLGLGMGNHHLLVLLTLPGLGVLAGLPPRRLVLPLLLLGLLMGSLYLFLPLRAQAGALLSWGQPDTWERFYAVVTARAYQRSFQHLELRHVVSNLSLHGALAIQLWGEPLLLLGGVGLMRLRRRPRLLLGLLLLLSGNLVATVGQTVFFPDNPDALGYLTLSTVLLGLLAGLGWMALLEWAEPLLGRLSSRWLRQGVVGLLSLSLALLPALRAWPQPALVEQDSQFRMGKLLLRDLEPGARLFVGSDASSFAVWFQQGVLRARPDVQVLSPFTAENAQGMRLPPPLGAGQTRVQVWALPEAPPLVEAQLLHGQLMEALARGPVGLVGLDLPLPLTERLRVAPARFLLVAQPGTPLLSGLDEALVHWEREAVRLKRSEAWRRDRQGRLLYGAHLEQVGDWLLELSLPRLALKVYRLAESLDPDPLRLVRLKRFRLEQQLERRPVLKLGQSVAGQSVAGQPVAEQSVAGQSVAEQSVVGQPVAEQSVVGQRLLHDMSEADWRQGQLWAEMGALPELSRLLSTELKEGRGLTLSSRLRWLLAWRARLEGRPEQALEQVRALLGQLPAGSEARAEVLRIFAPLMVPAEAIEWLRGELQQRPDGGLAAQLGLRLWQAQALEAAEQLLSSGLKLTPEQAELYVGLGWLRVSQGRLPEALLLAQQAAQWDPVLPAGLRLQSYLYRNGLR